MTEEEKPLTKEEVLKLIEEHGGPQRLDLSGKNLKEIDLSDKAGQRIHLPGIILRRANLQGANLQGAFLGNADLNSANLLGANLQGSFLVKADLRDADLITAELQGAILTFAKLQGACLFGAEISQATDFEDTDWGNYILDEEKMHPSLAVGTYRMLKMWHTNAGMYDKAGEFFYREMTVRRKAFWLGDTVRQPLRKLVRPFKPKELLKALLPQKPLQWSWSMLYNVLCGYGERPLRVVASAAVVVLGLAGIYSASALSFPSALYHSAVSFTAVGYGLWVSNPEGWVKGLGAAEAFVGVFMMALFLITFVRKMTR
jgi:hypothetical protein